MNTTIKFFFLFFLATSTHFTCFGETYISKTGQAMGTSVTITASCINDSDILEKTFDRIRELETVFSVYRDMSEISRLNRKRKMEVSADTAAVLNKSFYISRKTEGAFDVTIKPLLNLYSQAEKRGYPPSEQELSDTLENVGWNHISIEGNTASIPPGVLIDLGAIAKGYIVDAAAEFLAEKGVKNGMINAGGDIYAFGKNPRGGKWRIGVRSPFSKGGMEIILGISGAAVATSGNYERYYNIGEERIGHILNPKTGKSVNSDSASVTVIYKDCASADGYATAFFVLGRETSIEIAEKTPGLEVMIIDRDRKTYMSSGFHRFILEP